MSSMRSSTKYMYKSSSGGGGDISIEYGTDLGALTRLEVRHVFDFDFFLC